MKLRSLSPVLFSICLFCLVIIFYLYLTQGGNWHLGIIPIVIFGIALLVFKTEIDRYFLKRQDVEIDDRLYKMLCIEYPYILNFNEEQTKCFKERMFHFTYEKEAYLIGSENEKLDEYHVVLCCAPAVIMGINMPFDDGGDIERIVAYKHAFPSPKMQFIHPVEYDEEDGMMIFSIEQLFQSLRRQHVYHIMYHGWAFRHLKKYGALQIMASEATKLNEIFQCEANAIDRILGYQETNFDVLCLVAYMMHKDRMEKIDPQLFQRIDNYLNNVKIPL